MILNPKFVIEQGWVSGDIDPNQIQPNAIDFTIDRLFEIDESTPFIISEQSKTMRKGGEITPRLFRTDDDDIVDGTYWMLPGNTVHDAMSNMHVKVPDNVAVHLIIRSTFNRNGLFLTSGLYDTGFDGSIGFAIHNRSGVAYIAPGTRVGQIIFTTADSEGKYAGQYNTDTGKHWRE